MQEVPKSIDVILVEKFFVGKALGYVKRGRKFNPELTKKKIRRVIKEDVTKFCMLNVKIDENKKLFIKFDFLRVENIFQFKKV